LGIFYCYKTSQRVVQYPVNKQLFILLNFFVTNEVEKLNI